MISDVLGAPLLDNVQVIALGLGPYHADRDDLS